MMGHMPRTPDYIQLPTTRDRITRAIDDELRAHSRCTDRRADGGGPREYGYAREQALREFGDLDAAKRDLRRIDELAAGTTRFSDAADDLAAYIGAPDGRSLGGQASRPSRSSHSRSGSAPTPSCSASWIACCPSPPPHFRAPDQIVRLRFDEAQRDGGRIQRVRSSFPAFQLLGTDARVFSEITAYADRALTFTAGELAEEARVLAVTPLTSDCSGQAAVGRFFDDASTSAADAAGGRDQPCALDAPLAGDASVLGRPIQLRGEPFTVVGVVPDGFTGDGIEPVDAWIPLVDGSPAVPSGWATNPNMCIASVVARLRSDFAPSRRLGKERTVSQRARGDGVERPHRVGPSPRSIAWPRHR